MAGRKAHRDSQQSTTNQADQPIVERVLTPVPSVDIAATPLTSPVSTSVALLATPVTAEQWRDRALAELGYKLEQLNKGDRAWHAYDDRVVFVTAFDGQKHVWYKNASPQVS